LRSPTRISGAEVTGEQVSPVLVIMVGLVGTGKSTIAAAVAQRYGMIVVSSDIVRKQLAGVAAGEHRYESFDRGIYTKDFSMKTYDAMFHQASGLLSKGKSVVLDASFRKVVERKQAQKLAKDRGARFLAIECVVSEIATKERLDRRQSDGTSASDGRREIYDAIKQDFERIEELDPPEHLVVENAGPLDEVLKQTFRDLDKKLFTER